MSGLALPAIRLKRTSYCLWMLLGWLVLTLAGCNKHKEHSESVHHKVVVTTPKQMDVVVTQQYVCQIHSHRHIEIRALQEGYLEQIPVKEGQTVKAGDVLFKVLPTLYKTRLDAEKAEAELALLELNNTKRLHEQKVVSIQEVALFEAKLARAKAKVAQAEAEFNFTIVKAPYDGIIDRLRQQQGSLVKKEDLLTTLSDNSLMWVYFNVPEARYLEYMSNSDQEKQSTDSVNNRKILQRYPDDKDNRQIELVLANGSKFSQTGKIGAIEADFNNETGNIAFRADFVNPDGLLRNGQTGNVLIHQKLHDALVIPQRATFEILDKRFVYVLDKDNVVQQREIVIEQELDDIFVIKKGLDAKDRFVVEGVRQVHHGDKVSDYELKEADEVLSKQKYHSE
ncbi:MAG: efflux RND transporter periplasmic adaptor subunit [Planctomycetia bacterium]|nr:efflux RND transporter periplasmic adaptor subunit [Planctomycetia bacterium]